MDIVTISELSFPINNGVGKSAFGKTQSLGKLGLIGTAIAVPTHPNLIRILVPASNT
jgi:hypothetical protein